MVERKLCLTILYPPLNINYFSFEIVFYFISYLKFLINKPIYWRRKTYSQARNSTIMVFYSYNDNATVNNDANRLFCNNSELTNNFAVLVIYIIQKPRNYCVGRWKFTPFTVWKLI